MPKPKKKIDAPPTARELKPAPGEEGEKSSPVRRGRKRDATREVVAGADVHPPETGVETAAVENEAMPVPLPAGKEEGAPSSLAPGASEEGVPSSLAPEASEEGVPSDGSVEGEEPIVEEDKPLFQAIGSLQTKVARDESERFYIEFGGTRYDLYFPRNAYRAWLKEYEKNPDKLFYLRVYPKCRLVPRQEPTINFEVIGWNEENPFEEGSGIFRFRGVWQFVPQSRSPVVTVYRNKGAIDPKEKFKASHLPVMMRREDGVNPFRFNPKIPKEELPPRYFIQARFRFIPSRNCWGWLEDVEPPTTEIPRYKKPVKSVAPGGKPNAPAENPDRQPRVLEREPSRGVTLKPVPRPVKREIFGEET